MSDPAASGSASLAPLQAEGPFMIVDEEPPNAQAPRLPLPYSPSSVSPADDHLGHPQGFQIPIPSSTNHPQILSPESSSDSSDRLALPLLIANPPLDLLDQRAISTPLQVRFGGQIFIPSPSSTDGGSPYSASSAWETLYKIHVEIQQKHEDICTKANEVFTHFRDDSAHLRTQVRYLYELFHQLATTTAQHLDHHSQVYKTLWSDFHSFVDTCHRSFDSTQEFVRTESK